MQRRSIGALVAALGLVLTACGGGGGTKKEAGEANGKCGPSSAASDINLVALDKVADGGTMQWPVTEIPPNMNYHQLDGTLRDTAEIVEAAMSSRCTFCAPSVTS